MANLEDVAVKLEAVDQRAKSNTKRLDALDEKYEAINRLATALEVMAHKQDSMGKSIEKPAGKVSTLEAEPAKRWRLLVEKGITILLAAVLGFILAQLGL